MKKGFLILMLAGSYIANGQSLKEALYGGRLKNDPGSVIRKGDDLTAKIRDTTQKAVAVDSATMAVAVTTPDSSAVSRAVSADTATAIAGVIRNEPTSDNSNTAAATITPATVEPAAAPKDNNVIWKGHMDSLVTALKTEVLSSKKVKNGSYYVLVSYTIGTDGAVTVGDVFLSPESSYLQDQIKERLSFDLPRLNPVLSSSGAPRKVSKKYNFTLVKE